MNSVRPQESTAKKGCLRADIESRLQFGEHLTVVTESDYSRQPTVTKHSRAVSLIRLLPMWASPQIPVFAVYSNRKFLPFRLSVYLKALAAWNSPLWIKE
jgi:hypothetical protein